MVTTEPIGPAVFGLLRPTVVLPQTLILPSPFGRGAGGEGRAVADALESDSLLSISPHPNPLPRGEGTCCKTSPTADRADPRPRVGACSPGRYVLGRAAVGRRSALVVPSAGVVGQSRNVPPARTMLRRGGRGRVEVSAGRLCPMFARCLGVGAELAADAGRSGSAIHGSHVKTSGGHYEPFEQFSAKTPRWSWAVLIVAAVLVLPGKAIVLGQIGKNEPKETAAGHEPEESIPSVESPVAVLVVGPDGRPVERAEVQAYDAYVPLQSFRTNQHGVFRIPGKWLTPDGHMYLLVTRKGESVGWRWLSWPFQQSGDESRIGNRPMKVVILPRTRTLEGVCLDSNGRPVTGTFVRVLGLSGLVNVGPVPTVSDWFGVATSDAEGRYSIRVPEYQTCSVVAEHPKYVPVQVSYRTDNAGPKQVVLAESAGAVQGRVLDSATNLPIRGAAIHSQSLTPRMGMAGCRTAVSDDNGRYNLTSMAPGSWNILFSGIPGRPDRTAVAAEGVEVKAGETTAADFRVAPGRLLCGEVIDAAKNTPLAGVSVGYYGAARPRSGAACLMVKTDAKGRFEFHVPPGESYVYVAQEFNGKPTLRSLIVEADKDPAPVVFKGVLEQRSLPTGSATKPWRRLKRLIRRSMIAIPSVARFARPTESPCRWPASRCGGSAVPVGLEFNVSRR